MQRASARAQGAAKSVEQFVDHSCSFTDFRVFVSGTGPKRKHGAGVGTSFSITLISQLLAVREGLGLKYKTKAQDTYTTESRSVKPGF